jgi:hypothetical protein
VVGRGHAQLFIAAALPVVGLLLLIAAAGEPGMTFYGLLALMMAGPFLYSGLLLRGSSRTLPRPLPPIGFFGWTERIVLLTIIVAGIAALAIAGVYASMFAAVIFWTGISQAINYPG